MITTLAIGNYRSLLDLVIPMGPLNLVTGANGSGKSNLYRALRMLAETAEGGVIGALAREGGLESCFWAGPAEISGRMERGEVPIQGVARSGPKRLRLGFAGPEFGYAVSFGTVPPRRSLFSLDPEIKRECIWAGPLFRQSALLVDRKGPALRSRTSEGWGMLPHQLEPFESMLSEVADPSAAPEIFLMQKAIRSWRFYDHFRSDSEAPARQAQLGTYTPVLHHDGRNLAAALQTVREIGDVDALDEAVEDAFPGSSLEIGLQEGGRFVLRFRQRGLLRELSGAELSDGTLRYLLWIAAMLTPRPPPLMVLNEPETSLHPDLLPALGRLIIRASRQSQVWVVSHAPPLIEALSAHRSCQRIRLQKDLSRTVVQDLDDLEAPPWNWHD